MVDERNNTCHFCNIIFKRHYNLKVHLKEQRCKSNLLNDWYKLNTILNKKDILIKTYQYQIKEHYGDDINEFTKNTNKKLTEEYKLLLKNEIIDELKDKIKSEIDEKSINKYKKEVEQNVKKNMKNIVLRKYKKNKNNENETVQIQTRKPYPLQESGLIAIKRGRGRPKKQKVIDILTQSENSLSCTNSNPEHSLNQGTNNNEDNTNIVNNIMINPINKLNLKDNIQNNKNLIIKYEKHKHNCSDDLLQSMLSDYIKNLILNKNNPENHCIKYIKKKPPTYNIKILDENNNNPTYIIKKLHECPVILYDPICKIIKKQLKSLLYKSSNNNEDDDDDLEYTNNTVHSLANQLTHHHGQKILMRSIKSVLHNNILFDKEMKFTF